MISAANPTDGMLWLSNRLSRPKPHLHRSVPGDGSFLELIIGRSSRVAVVKKERALHDAPQGLGYEWPGGLGGLDCGTLSDVAVDYCPTSTVRQTRLYPKLESPSRL